MCIMIQAFIFDMDGVIVDSEPLHIQSEIFLLKKHGVNVTHEDLYEFMGNTVVYMFQTLKKRYKMDVSVETLCHEKDALYIPLLKERGEAVPYIREILKKLYEKKIPLALASSSPGKFIDIVLDTLNIRPYFQYIISGEELKESKPHPEIFLNSAKNLNVSPENCCVIEDSYSGVTAAKRANMKCIGFENIHSGDQDLSQSDVTIDSLETFFEAVQKIETNHF